MIKCFKQAKWNKIIRHSSKWRTRHPQNIIQDIDEDIPQQMLSWLFKTNAIERRFQKCYKKKKYIFTSMAPKMSAKFSAFILKKKSTW